MVDSFVFRRGQVKRFHSHIMQAEAEDKKWPGPGHRLFIHKKYFSEEYKYFSRNINIFIFHQI